MTSIQSTAPAGRSPRPAGVRRLGVGAARWAFVAALAWLVVVPLVRVQSTALENSAASYKRVAKIPGYGSTLTTTVAFGVGSLVLAMVLGTALAWASVRLPRRWGWMAAIPILPIVIPPVANVTGWAFLFNPTVGYANRWLRTLPFFDGTSGPIDIYTRGWIIAITGLSLSSFVYVFVRSGLRRLDAGVIEAAEVAGASTLRTFFGTVLPMIRPSLIYGAAVALLLGLGQFTAPLLLGTRQDVRVISTEVYQYVSTTTDYGLAAAIASPLLAVGIVMVVVQRGLLRQQDRFAGDTGKGIGAAIGTSRSAPVPIALFGLSTILAPLFGLIVVSLSPFWSGDIAPSNFTLRHFEAIFDSPIVPDAIWTSLILSAVGVLCSLPVGYVAAEIIFKRRSAPLAAWLIDVIANLPLGIPSVVFGAGFLFTYTQGPFVLYGTKWVIVVVYVTLMLPFATRLQLGARLSMGTSYEEAARSCGAGLLRAHTSILIPMCRGALSGAGALIFVMLSHEFTASLFVRSSRTQVMGTALYDIWITSSYGQVAAMALVMCVVTAAGVFIAVAAGGGSQTLDRL